MQTLFQLSILALAVPLMATPIVAAFRGGRFPRWWDAFLMTALITTTCVATIVAFLLNA